MNKERLTQKELKKVLKYDPKTGLFTRIMNIHRFRIGEVAGCKAPSGYIMIRVNRELYRAHRLAFLYITGNFPKYQVDHINGVRDDNRFINLREANKQQNAFNRGKQKNNLLGIKGVCKDKERGIFRAYAKLNGRSKFLGRFLTKEKASEAYQKFARAHHGGFHYG